MKTYQTKLFTIFLRITNIFKINTPSDFEFIKTNEIKKLSKLVIYRYEYIYRYIFDIYLFNFFCYNEIKLLNCTDKNK